MTAQSKAYMAGYEDGLAWDLDGFATREDVERDDGWARATINACGNAAFFRRIGVGQQRYVDRVLSEYNRGARDGALAPQSQRKGLPIGGKP